MIDAKVGVIGLSVLAEGVVWIVEKRAHMAAEHEAAAEPDGTESINTVGILEDFRFDGLGSDIGGETVSRNGVVNGVEMLGGIVVFFEGLDCVVGGETGSLGTLGGVLGNVNAVVEVGGGEENLERKAFNCGEVSGVEDDTLDVLGIVCGISFSL